MKNIIKQYKLVLPTLILGLILGWLIFGGKGNSQQKSNSGDTEQVADGTMWTCSMHPQIKQDKFGLCPICAMDLIPMEVTGGTEEGVDPNEVALSKSAAKLADIQTYHVHYGDLDKEIFLQGKLTEDERTVAEVTARFGGRIEDLYVNFTGQKVSKGQKLASLYSPEIITAQKELHEALKVKATRPALYEAAKNKLALWSLTEEQIAEIENADHVLTHFDILSPIAGVVSMRHVAKGDYVKPGEQLFKVVDLSHLWLQFDAYESDIQGIQVGNLVEYQLKAIPGKVFSGKISFVDPVFNSKTRVAKLRVDVTNKGGELKPEMYATGIITPQNLGDQMLLIPKSAVLWTGKRSIIYVQVPDRENPSFMMREVLLGSESEDQYQVVEGLDEHEVVVANGAFKIDASAQLRGLPSMMNPGGGMITMAHNHDNSDVDSDELEDHSEHDGAMTQMNDSVALEEIEKYEVDPQFQVALNDLLKVYLPMKDAFVLTHAKKVRKAAKKLQPVLIGIDMALLEGEAHMMWMDQFQEMKTAIEKIIETKDVEKQRMHFSDFNTGFYKAVKSFGLNDQKVYYQFCPMAFDDKGAYWISSEEIIANPYFGDVMMRCGEVKEIIEN